MRTVLVRTLVRVAVVAWLVGAGIGTASASEPSYEQLVAEAVDEYSRANFAEARRLFELAHRTQPNARTLRGLGIVEYELREYARAVAHLELALEDRRNPLTDAQRSEAQQLLERAWRFVGRYRLRVDPAVTSLRVDGRARAARDGVELRLDPGEHRIIAEGDGRAPLVLDLTVRGGEREELTLRLPAQPDPAGGAARQPDAERQPETERGSPAAPAHAAGAAGPPPAAIVALSAGALGLLTFAVAGGLALDEHGELESSCAPACSDAQLESFDAYVLAADVGLAVGLLGAALGTWLWLDDDGDAEPAPSLSLELSPGATAIRARGRF